jgi:nucleoside-diphosphate-sugar epimerase
MVGNIYNVGLSSANLSKLELCQSIAEHIPDFVFLEAEVGKDPDQRNYIVSNAKLESTGFSTMFDLNYGIKELVQAFTILRNRKYGNI